MKLAFMGAGHPLRLAFALCSAVAPVSALAHSEAAGSGLMSGLLHPVTGMDHLLAMLSVGIVSVRLGGAHIWRIPAAFVSTMALGAWAGFHGWLTPPYEAGIAWSVLLLGLAIACDGARRAVSMIFVCVALFGVCHGYAHGAEIPAADSALFYVTGFLISTVFIHVVGIFIGELASSSRRHTMALRASGVAMSLAGVWFVAH